MIRLISHKNITGIFFSLLLFAFYGCIISYSTSVPWLLLLGLFAEGICLNYLCYRYGILGKNTALPLVLFSVLVGLIILDLSVEHIEYGFLFLLAMYSVYESKDHPKKQEYLIFLGIGIGITQAFAHQSFLLILPVIALFFQEGTLSRNGFTLFIMYFLMTIASIAGIIFILGDVENLFILLPQIVTHHIGITNPMLLLILPILGISIIYHLIHLNQYKFRFPNLSKNINYTFLVQFVLGSVLVFIYPNQFLLSYSIMAIVIILSFAFAYQEDSVFANALFTSIIISTLGWLIISQILFL